MKLDGMNVLVTGANRGIGAAFVDVLMERGAAKVYAGAREPLSLADAAERYGPRLVPVQLDVTDATQVQAAALLCADLDLLVSNAGKGLMAGVLDPPDDLAARAVFETNFFGPMHLVRALAPTLRQRKGGIIFVQSTGAVALSRSSPVYSASKAACLMMALGVRQQLHGDAVTVTNVFPGYVATDMTAGMTSPKVSARLVAQRSVDGWLGGVDSVFPDRFSQLVAEAVEHRMLDLLDDPHLIMNAVVASFNADPLAGS